jgi:hypothetical protein
MSYVWPTAATDRTVPASASPIDDTICAATSTSSAFDDSATASGSGKRFGFTRTSRERPIVFMARAVDPMLPGWLVWESTTRMRERRSSGSK